MASSQQKQQEAQQQASSETIMRKLPESSDAGIDIEDDEDDGPARAPSAEPSQVARLDSYSFSMLNLQESQDNELDAILGELCALGSQFERELHGLRPAQTTTSGAAASTTVAAPPKAANGAATTSSGNGSSSRPSSSGVAPGGPGLRSVTGSADTSGVVRADGRTESPDNDSAFSDSSSMLSGESSASSGARTSSSSHDSGAAAAAKPHASGAAARFITVNTTLGSSAGGAHDSQLDAGACLHDVRQQTQAEQAAQLKAEKIKMALQKLKEASIRKLFIKVFCSDGSAKSLLVDETMSVAYLTKLLVEKSHVPMDPKWALVETIPELYMERVYEEHENLVENLLLWTRDSCNRVLFEERPLKYDVFAQPEKYLADSGTQTQLDVDEDQRTALIEEFFHSPGTSGVSVPEVEGLLYLKAEGKKHWKKHFFVLRASGLYYCPRGKSKLPKDLVCLTTFEMNCVYFAFGWKKKYKAPSEYGFAVKHPQIQSKSCKNIKYLCADDLPTLNKWVTGIRIAKYGRQIKDNYDAIQRDIVEADLEKLAYHRSFSVSSMAKQLSVSPDSSNSSGASPTADSACIEQPNINRQQHQPRSRPPATSGGRLRHSGSTGSDSTLLAETIAESPVTNEAATVVMQAGVEPVHADCAERQKMLPLRKTLEHTTSTVTLTDHDAVCSASQKSVVCEVDAAASHSVLPSEAIMPTAPMSLSPKGALEEATSIKSNATACTSSAVEVSDTLTIAAMSPQTGLATAAFSTQGVSISSATLRRRDSVASSAGSSSIGSMSDRSSDDRSSVISDSAGAAAGVAFDIEYPFGGTIKRKPNLAQPRLPLTNTTRSLVVHNNHSSNLHPQHISHHHHNIHRRHDDHNDIVEKISGTVVESGVITTGGAGSCVSSLWSASSTASSGIGSSMDDSASILSGVSSLASSAGVSSSTGTGAASSGGGSLGRTSGVRFSLRRSHTDDQMTATLARLKQQQQQHLLLLHQQQQLHQKQQLAPPHMQFVQQEQLASNTLSPHMHLQPPLSPAHLGTTTLVALGRVSAAITNNASPAAITSPSASTKVNCVNSTSCVIASAENNVPLTPSKAVIQLLPMPPLDSSSLEDVSDSSQQETPRVSPKCQYLSTNTIGAIASPIGKLAVAATATTSNSAISSTLSRSGHASVPSGALLPGTVAPLTAKNLEKLAINLANQCKTSLPICTPAGASPLRVSAASVTPKSPALNATPQRHSGSLATSPTCYKRTQQNSVSSSIPGISNTSSPNVTSKPPVASSSIVAASPTRQGFPESLATNLSTVSSQLGFSSASIDSLPPPPPPLPLSEQSWPSASSLSSLPPPPSNLTTPTNSPPLSNQSTPTATGSPCVLSKAVANGSNGNSSSSSSETTPTNDRPAPWPELRSPRTSQTATQLNAVTGMPVSPSRAKPAPPRRSVSTRLSVSGEAADLPCNSNHQVSQPGHMPSPPETFLRDLQRVMDKKWKVAQTLNMMQDHTAHQILGFRDPRVLSEEERKEPPLRGILVAESTSPAGSTGVNARPQKTVRLDLPGLVCNSPKAKPMPPKRSDSTQLSCTLQSPASPVGGQHRLGIY